MKKIISIFAAVALALGVAGCSNDGSSLFYNDLHDAVVSPLYIEGDIVESRTALTMLSNTEQEFKFTYKNTMSSWGGGKGVANFKIVRDSSGWLKDWGAEKDTTVNLVVNADYTNLAARDAANDNPGNIVLKDLAENQEYVLKVNYNAVAGTVALKCEGKVVSYPELKVVFVSDDGKGGVKEETIPMTRTDKTFKYVFTPKEEDTLYFYISDGNYLYWGNDGKILPAKLDLDNDTDKLSAVTIEKNKEGVIPAYSISVDVAELPEISISAGVDDTSILGRYGVIGITDWDDVYKLTKEEDGLYSFEFTNTGSEVSFALTEIANKWKTRFFMGNSGAYYQQGDVVDVVDDATAVKYGEELNYAPIVYYTSNPGLGGKNIKVTGLPYTTGHKMKLYFKVVNEAEKKVSVACIAADDTVPAGDYDKSNFDSCYKLNNIKYVCSCAGNKEITWGSKESDGSYIGTVEFPVGTPIGDWGKACLQFGVTDTTSWGKKYTGATITENGGYVELTQGANDNNECTTISSGNTTKKVTIYIKSTADKLYAKIVTE